MCFEYDGRYVFIETGFAGDVFYVKLSVRVGDRDVVVQCSKPFEKSLKETHYDEFTSELTEGCLLKLRNEIESVLRRDELEEKLNIGVYSNIVNLIKVIK